MQTPNCHKIYPVVEECTLCGVESIWTPGDFSKRFKYLLYVVENYIIVKTASPVYTC